MVTTLRPSKRRTQPEKCTVGMPCGGECVSKVDPRSGKAKQCRGNAQGFTKESLQWLANTADSKTFGRELNRANRDKDRIAAGQGRFRLKDGQVQEEDMSAYLTQQKRVKGDRPSLPPTEIEKASLLERPSSSTLPPTDLAPTELPTPGTPPTIESVLEKPSLKVSSLNARAEKAEAIASNSTSPETQRRALKLADRFKALSKRVQDFERSRRNRVRQARLKSSQEAAIASIKAPSQVSEPRNTQAKGRSKPKLPTLPPINRPSSAPTVTPSNAPTVDLKPKGTSKPKPNLPPIPQFDDPADIPSLNTMRGKGNPLGQGQYGVVYRDGDRAIKYSTQGKIDRKEFDIGKRAEALGVGPKMYGIRDSNGRSAMAMEFIDGSPLLNEDVKKGIMNGQDIDDALQLMATLHRNGISHNDMHPGNLIRGKDGQLKVIDWGRAQINDQTRIMREFMRPWFMNQSYRTNSGEIKHRPYKVRGKTQYAKRYAKAQADFSRRYGSDTAKWPKGKAAGTAIGDFYKQIFG